MLFFYLEVFHSTGMALLTYFRETCGVLGYPLSIWPTGGRPPSLTFWGKPPHFSNPIWFEGTPKSCKVQKPVFF